MIYRQYVGIYIDSSGAQSTTCHKLLPGLLPGKRGVVKTDTATHTGLARLLETLKPSRHRRIFMALPRRHFYLRQMEFPDLPLDDIRDSVVNSLDIYSHLPLEDIYYDVLFTPIRGKGVNALLFYAPRKKLEAYLQPFRDTGHIKSLESIVPFSYGAGAFFQKSPPARGKSKENALGAWIIQYPDAVELAVYRGDWCINSFLLDEAMGEDRDGAVRDILAGQELPMESVQRVDTSAVPGPKEETKNLGGVALTSVFSRIQAVHVDENLPRIKLFKPLRVLLPLFMICIVSAAWMTKEIREDIAVRQTELNRVEQEIKAIEGKITPIIQAKDALEKAAAYKGDVEDFAATKPPLYTYINDLAGIVPEDTWFAHLAYKPGVISMQGEGDDVLKVVEVLRESKKYKEVKVKGSVSRTKEGKDKFNIDLVLKEPADTIKGRTDR